MTFTMTQGDRNVVSNVRLSYKDAVAQYSDETIAQAWRMFSQSDEYPDHNNEVFPEWCQMVHEGHV